MAAITAGTIWEVMGLGADTNGGGFDASYTGAGGVDYSRQIGPQYSTSIATAAGAGATLSFAIASADMVGNVCQVSAASGVTAGFYTIISVAVGSSITLNANVTTAAASGVTVKIGGALATPSKPASALVPGNKMYIKGSLSRSSSDTFSVSGTAALPIVFEGYTSTRGDAYDPTNVRINGVKGLVLTNVPTITYAAGSIWNMIVAYNQLRNLAFVGSYGFGGIVITGANATMIGCSITNTSTAAGSTAAGIGITAFVIDCDFSSVGTSASTCLSINNNGFVVNCRATCTNGIGVTMGYGGGIFNSLVYGSAVGGISVSLQFGTSNIVGCTVVGCGYGVKLYASSTSLCSLINLMVTDNTGAAIDFNSPSIQTVVSYSYFRNNNSAGSYVDFINTSTSPPVERGNKHASNGSAYTDYVSQATGDYTIASTSGAYGMSQPYFSSPGCVQAKAGGVSLLGGGLILMANYVGDFAAASIVRFSFNSRDSSGNPITLAGSPVVSIYKSGSTIEVTTGVTLVVDYDSRTGYHQVTVDTSADGAFYSAGSDFRAVITTGTVAGISVVGNEVGQFSLANRSAAPTVAAIRAEMDSNSTKLAAAATATNVSSAQTAIIAALPGAAPTVAAIRAEMDSNSTKLAAAATATNVSSAQTAIIAALPGAAPTAAAIRAEMDANSTKLAAILAAGGGGGVLTVSAFTDAALLAMRTNLTGVVTVAAGPVFGTGGSLSIEITSGDDYLLADSRQIDIPLDGSSLPDLTGASVSLRLSSGVRVLVSGSVVVATGSVRTVRFCPASTDTAGLVPGVNGVFAVLIVTAAGHRITPKDGRGVLIVRPRIVG